MNELVLKNEGLKSIRKFLGIILILAGTAWFIANLENIRVFDILYFLVFLAMGLSHLTNSFGQEKTWLKYEEGNIIIKWFNRFRPLIIDNSNIENLYLARTEVYIKRKEAKPVRLSLSAFETAQKKEIYEFFIKYCSDKNIELIRNFDKLKVTG